MKALSNEGFFYEYDVRMGYCEGMRYRLIGRIGNSLVNRYCTLCIL